MPSPNSLLLTLFLTVLQSVLSVDAKGGGKGGKGGKSSKNKNKNKSDYEVKPSGSGGQRCYNEKYALSFLLTSPPSPSLNARHVEIPCPGKKKTALIAGIVVGVIVGKYTCSFITVTTTS